MSEEESTDIVKTEKRKYTKKIKDKYMFTLVNINFEHVHSMYGLTPLSLNISPIEESSANISNTTQISDLILDKQAPSTISFLDELKHVKKCNVSIINFITKTEIPHSKYSCFWDRNPIDTPVIGCPINYIPRELVKKYFSEISKDNYTIKDYITASKTNNIKKFIEENKCKQPTEFFLVNRDCYETDGSFCSFNCLYAFILDNKRDPLYTHSEMLFFKMYKDITGSTLSKILPAPHWRYLKEYGGSLDIHTFRNGFNRILYENHGIIRNLNSPIGMLYEEHIKI